MVKLDFFSVNHRVYNLKLPLSKVINTAVKYPLIMVFLGACAFTMMLNFQTTYASTIGMNYAYFYAAYSLAVILSRFLLGKYLADFNQYKLSIFLLIIMTTSLFLFLFSSFSIYLYILNSILFGISYGLVYPTIQAITVNLAEEPFRADVISYFSLSYFIGVYAFPSVGGYLIVHLGYNGLILRIASLAAIELLLSYILYKKMPGGKC